MLQITADLASMNEAQREALAGFVLAFPNNDGTVFQYDGPDSFKAFARRVFEEPKEEMTPAAAFGSAPQVPYMPSETISVSGPTLVIPSPTLEAAAPPPPSAPAPPPPSGEAGVPPSAGNAQVGNTLVIVDSKGLPWDSRIHATGKTFTNDGSWRKKRGVSDVQVFEVERELRALMAIPSPPVAGVAQPPSVASPSVPPPPSGQAPPPPPPPPANNVVAIDEVEARRQFVTLVGRTSAAIATKKLTEEQLLKCLNSMGVPSLQLLANRLDLVPAVQAMTDGIIAGQSL